MPDGMPVVVHWTAWHPALKLALAAQVCWLESLSYAFQTPSQRHVKCIWRRGVATRNDGTGRHPRHDMQSLNDAYRADFHIPSAQHSHLTDTVHHVLQTKAELHDFRAIWALHCS